MPDSDTIRTTLRSGGVIAYPTEGVWGLGCLPDNEAAVERIFELKSRSIGKGLILLAATAEQFDRFAPGLTAGIPEPGERPVTYLVPHHGAVPGWIHGGQPRVAVRLTRHVVVGGICAAVDSPIVSTSANPAGAQPALAESEVRGYFGDQLSAIVPGELGGASGPSKIVDLATGEVVRE